MLWPALYALLGALFLGVVLRLRHDASDVWGRALALSRAHHAVSLLAAAREGGLRYEVHLTDRGAAEGAMRYRWTVWDADSALRISAYDYPEPPDPAVEDADTPVRVDVEDPEGVLGVESPYMLGDAPTREQAMAEAMAWVQQQDDKRVVLPAGLWYRAEPAAPVEPVAP